MPWKPIPFWNEQESGYEELSGASPIAMNVVKEPKGAVRRRPGLRAASGATSSVIDSNGLSGIYAALNGKLYAVGGVPGNRAIYEVGPSGATNLSLYPTTGYLTGTSRPTFAETEMLIVVAAGRDMHKIEKAAPVCTRLGGSPPFASHVVANASRLLANDTAVLTSRISVSDVATGTVTYAGHETWTFGVGDASFFTAESRPDKVVALVDSTNEIFVFGETSLQTWGPDPSLVYAPHSTLEVGCAAPYSIIKADETLAWLDDQRRFVMSEGRSLKVISEPIADTLLGIGTISDCFGFRVHRGFLDAMVWVFPTDGRTFVFQKGAGWGQWSGWSDALGTWTPTTITGFTQRTGYPENLVCTSAGTILAFDMDTPTDGGARVVARVETGYLNQSTDLRKHCQCVRLVFRRDTFPGSPGQVGYLGFRDSPSEEWRRVPVELQEGQSVVELRSLGVYRRRQWFFEFSGTTEVVLAGATEEYEVSDQ